MKWQIKNAVLYPENSGKGLVFANGMIDQILESNHTDPDILGIDLHGLPVFPGLFNSHDSLMASYYPLDKPATPYRNWLAFDNDIKSSTIFQERMRIDIGDLYDLGSYKNIINGVTYVIDHIPEFVRKPFINTTLVQLLPDYGISHSVGSYNLNWGKGYRKEHEYATQNDLPYILHIAEGVDLESKESLRRLDDMGALSENTVLVHGISLDAYDFELIAAKGAHLVWCPVSNMRLYGKTLDIKTALDFGINVCLGTDSAMTGSIGILNELAFAQNHFAATYKSEINQSQFVKMIIDNPLKAFRIKDRGSLKVSMVADCIVLGDRISRNPEEALLGATLKDVFLVIRNGQPVYADESLIILFEELDLNYTKINVNGCSKLIPEGYDQTLARVKQASKSNREFPFLPEGQ